MDVSALKNLWLNQLLVSLIYLLAMTRVSYGDHLREYVHK